MEECIKQCLPPENNPQSREHLAMFGQQECNRKTPTTAPQHHDFETIWAGFHMSEVQ